MSIPVIIGMFAALFGILLALLKLVFDGGKMAQSLTTMREVHETQVFPKISMIPQIQSDVENMKETFMLQLEPLKKMHDSYSDLRERFKVAETNIASIRNQRPVRATEYQEFPARQGGRRNNDE